MVWIFKCDLAVGSSRTNVSKGTSTSDGEQLGQIILKSIHNCRSYVPDKLRCTHAPMQIHQTVKVTTMSHSSQAGLTKMVSFQVNFWTGRQTMVNPYAHDLSIRGYKKKRKY